MAIFGTVVPGETFGFRNRIINGDMRIDQRNAGASVTPTDVQFTLDRWVARATQSSKFTVQQNAGSVTPPVGFINYLGVTSSSAYSVVASDFFSVNQPIEGYNIADLGWGTANAKTVTVSFWVRSSLTGTFAGAIRNNNSDYNYPFSYSISASNTWEQKSVTITGPTSGTWLTSNNRGAIVEFALGVGTDRNGTVNSWNASNIWSFSGATSVVGTSGATFYVTGVQLEVGSVATPFERRPFGTELSLCQRYYAKLSNDGSGDAASVGVGGQQSTTTCWFYIKHPVTMRSEPTVAISNLQNTDFAIWTVDATLTNTFAGYDASTIYCSMAANGAAYRAAGLIIKLNNAGFLALSSEL